MMNAVRSFAEKPIGDFTAHAAAFAIEGTFPSTKILGQVVIAIPVRCRLATRLSLIGLPGK